MVWRHTPPPWGPINYPAHDKTRKSFSTTLPPSEGAGRLDRIALPSGDEGGGLRCGALYDSSSHEDLLGETERGANYTIFSDSTAAIERATAGRAGPNQALARANIELEGLLIETGCSVTLRWAPAHKGVEGNGAADLYAKRAAEAPCGSSLPAKGEFGPPHGKRRKPDPDAPGSGCMCEMMSRAVGDTALPGAAGPAES